MRQKLFITSNALKNFSLQQKILDKLTETSLQKNLYMLSLSHKNELGMYNNLKKNKNKLQKHKL